MSIYPQLGHGSLGTPQGTANRITGIERRVARMEAVQTYIGDGSIDGDMVGRGAIGEKHIVALSITTASLAVGSVKADNIDVLAIRAGHMQAGSITATNAAIADLAVQRAKIADLAVDTAKIADATITSAKIGLLQVQEANIANLAVTNAKIVNLAVDSAKIANLAVDVAKIADLAVSTAKIQNLAVVNAKIADLAVDNAKIANLAVTNAKIVNLAVDSAKIADAAIITAKIGDAQITNAKVANLDASKIDAGFISTDRLAATAVVADTLLSRMIHGAGIVATTGLSAVSANLGTINAGTITGATVRSGTVGARWEGNSSGIRGYNSANVVTFAFDNATGKITTLAGIGGPNKLYNSRADDTTGVTFTPYNSTVARSTTKGRSGPNSFRVVATAAGSYLYREWNNGNAITVTPGEEITISAYVWGDQAVNCSINVRFGAGGELSGAYTDCTTTGWTRLVYTVTVPAGITRMGYGFIFSGAAGTAVNWTDLQIESGRIVTAYGPKPEELLPNAVGPTEIAPNAVGSTEIAENAVGASQLGPGVVRGSAAGGEVHIVPGTIIATDLFVTSLSAITGNMGVLNAGRISGGSIDGNVIDAGSIRASKIKVGFGGANKLPNARFSHFPTSGAGFVSVNYPGYWQVYDNGGGAATWSRVVGGGPGGDNSWRCTAPAQVMQNKGFRSFDPLVFLPNVSYVYSWWWKGDRQPDIATNTSFDLDNTWIENPAASTTVWQPYSKRVKSSAGGPFTGGTDWFYIQVSHGNNNFDCSIARPQLEEGEFASAHSTRPEEILPGAVGTTEILPGSIKTALIDARAITAEKITVTSLEALSSNMGTLTAGRISGGSIDGNVIDAGSLNANVLRVGSMSDTLILNAEFRQNAGEATMPVAWSKLGEGFGNVYGMSMGLQELAITAGNNSATSKAVPLVPGETYSVRIQAYHDTVGNAIYFRMNELTSEPSSGYISAGGYVRSGLTDLAGGVAISTVPTTYEYTYTVPAGVTWASLCFYNWTTTGYLRIKSVEFRRRLTGVSITDGAITAQKLTIGLGGTNRLLNSNFNDGIAGRGTNKTNWPGPYEMTVAGRAGPNQGYPGGGYAVYGTATNSNPHIYTPWVECFGWSKASFSIYTHNAVGRTHRFGVQFYNSDFSAQLGSDLFDETLAANTWVRKQYANRPVPSGAYYVRFYSQHLSCATEYVTWGGAQIEEGELVTGWSRAPEDIGPGEVGTTQILPGSINTGHLTASTLTGATIQTAASGARVEISGVAPVGIKKYAADGTTVTVKIGATDGLDLLAGTSETPLFDRRASWLLPDGGLATSIYGWETNGYYSQNVQAGSYSERILDSNGKSSFRLNASSWTAPAYIWASPAAMSHYDAAYANSGPGIGYRKVGNVVELRGTISFGAASAPSSANREVGSGFPVPGETNKFGGTLFYERQAIKALSSNGSVARFEIRTDGIMEWLSGGVSGVGTWFNFDGCTYSIGF